MLRRQFLRLVASLFGTGTVAPPALGSTSGLRGSSWTGGHVRHILATVSDREIGIKVSLASALARPPQLRVGGNRQVGVKSDTAGEFWQFRARSLSPGRPYRLVLTASDEDGNRPLCDPWELKTFPDRATLPDRVRVLFFTCAGGDERSGFLPVEIRSRLLRRGLSFKPDAAVANGDHIYHDLRPQRRAGNIPPGDAPARTVPVLGSENETMVKSVGNRQIVDVYGTDFRSTPVFFIQDDHDFFDNDEATEQLVTFPPDAFMSDLARVTQRLFYPEFLPDPDRPSGLPGDGLDTHGNPFSESFGTLRFGRLLEAPLYTVRRTMTLDGDDAVFVAPVAERWLTDRMSRTDALHLVNVPSSPFGWSAGKWGEWYPDRLGADGRLSQTPPKRFWQPGWLKQHDRLVSAMSSMRQRIALVVSGDLHASALGRLMRSGTVDTGANPIIAVLCGTIGTGPGGWPSRSRGVPPRPPLHVDMEEIVEPIEQHGFTIADFTPEGVELRMFVWDRHSQRPEEIDTLQPFRTYTVPRP